MFVLPLLAGVVGLVFGGLVFRQYRERHKPYQGAWALALLLFGVAALVEAYGTAAGWSGGAYKVYYLLGGILNVGWLAVGTLYLLAPGRVGTIAAVVMAVISIAAIPAVLVSATHAGLLHAAVPPRGAITGPATYFPLLTNVAGSVILIGGAAWSAFAAYRRSGPGTRVLGTALIAAGAFIVAGTHSMAQVGGAYAIQPAGEAAGIVVMFLGYLAVESRALPFRRSATT
jgi:hypothetical protein